MPSTPVPPERWTDPRHVRGLRGELLAAAFLRSTGWEIEAHRWRQGRHDVDLVIRRREVVAFVEVKTRRSLACGQPVEAVGRRKQRILARAAAGWIQRYGRPGDVYRFDLVGVLDPADGTPAVEHLPDAWRAEAG